MRILLIEDDPMLGKGLFEALTDAGMAVDWVRDGPVGEAALDGGEHALVLLDLSLPGKDGFELLASARQRGNAVPLLVISARDDLENRLAGLDLGADDYLTKPFEVRELLARIRSVLRRHAGKASSRLGNGEIELDLASHEVSYRGQVHVLPPREFALMQALTERPGTILSRGKLEDQLYRWGDEVESNAVDVLIHYIRKRFDKDVIRNVRGAGWMIPKSG